MPDAVVAIVADVDPYDLGAAMRAAVLAGALVVRLGAVHVELATCRPEPSFRVGRRRFADLGTTLERHPAVYVACGDAAAAAVGRMAPGATVVSFVPLDGTLPDLAPRFAAIADPVAVDVRRRALAALGVLPADGEPLADDGLAAIGGRLPLTPVDLVAIVGDGRQITVTDPALRALAAPPSAERETAIDEALVAMATAVAEALHSPVDPLAALGAALAAAGVELADARAAHAADVDRFAARLAEAAAEVGVLADRLAQADLRYDQLLADRVRQLLMTWTEHVTAAVHATIVVPATVEPAVSFVLVTYGTGAIIEECLAALAGSLVGEGLAYEVIVVDNAYPGGMSPADRLRLTTSGVRLIASDRNLGFGGGNDLGVANARAGVVCLMNPDLVVATGWLRPLLAAVADPAVGIAAPVLLDPDGTLQEAGQIVDSKAFTLPAEGDPGGATIDVDYSSAACWVLRAEVLEAVGGFDPAYHPAYFEDVDLVWRVRRSGLRTVLVGASRVVHVRGTSTRRRPTTVVSQQAVFRRRWRAELAQRA